MTYERTHTQADLSSTALEGCAPSAVLPPGDGWTMEGACALRMSNMAVRFVWYWRREARPGLQECQNPARPECRSVAFHEGKCLGCGWQPPKPRTLTPGPRS